MNKETLTTIHRRNFMKISVLTGAGLLVTPSVFAAESGDILKPSSFLRGLKTDAAPAPIEGAVWYIAEAIGDGLQYTFPTGALKKEQFLSADILTDGFHLADFHLILKEGENGPAFGLRYRGLNQAQARIRLPLSAVDQKTWLLGREGAWLKPCCEGARVDLAKVDRMSIIVIYKADEPVRWCQTPFTIVSQEPLKLTNPILPKGKLLDEMGQSAFHEWPGKTRSVDDLTKRLREQFDSAEQKRWPESFSRWGGWKEKKLEATGFFRTHHDGQRWLLVDPDGCYFWSTGLDCVESSIYAHCGGLENSLAWIPDSPDYKQVSHPGAINYLGANFIRAFGANDWKKNWAKITLSLLREFGFNTVANWSEWGIAKEAQFPYVIPLGIDFRETPMIYRDFPDVYHPSFQSEALRCGEQLKPLANDPALIGYFLMNEPSWGFSSETPAAGMLFTTPVCESRKKLAEFLGKRYPDNTALSQTWKMETTFERIAAGEWQERLTDEAKKDLQDFSEILVERYFKLLSDGCKASDPHHLNLGIRYQGVPPKWAVPGMRCFDVFSANCYMDRIPPAICKEISEGLKMPVIVGEFHFGALDVGLPSPGLVHVRTQADRGRAYRYYVEDAAANPYCVGVHYFTLYDESAMGRFDGENYNIGFLDTCNRPYEEMAQAARKTHERLYALASGDEKPFSDKPEYLPRMY